MEKIIVLFEVKPTKEGAAKYLELAAMLKPMLEEIPGFISAERFMSINEEGKILLQRLLTRWVPPAWLPHGRRRKYRREQRKPGYPPDLPEPGRR